MIVKAISNQDFALVQNICVDQWYFQRCHQRLRAIEIVSRPPGVELFQRFTDELVSIVPHRLRILLRHRVS